MRQIFGSSILAALIVVAPTLAGDGDYQAIKKQRQAERRERIQQLEEKVAPTIVTLKFVATTEMFGQESKSQKEVRGVLVGADGLVVIANSSLDPMGGVEFKVMGGMPGMEMPKPKHETGDYRIIIGDETEENEARLVARDSELDLAWFRMTNAKGRTLPYLHLGDSTKLHVGDTYYTIGRMAERFNRAPVVWDGGVNGRITAPRTLLVATGGSGPVFAEDGVLAGFLIQQPDEDGDDAAGPMVQMPIQFILPAEELAKATEQARKQSSK